MRGIDVKEKLKKVEELKEIGVEPYGRKYEKVNDIAEINQYDETSPLSSHTSCVRILHQHHFPPPEDENYNGPRRTQNRVSKVCEAARPNQHHRSLRQVFGHCQ